jgi:hypothetical protein
MKTILNAGRDFIINETTSPVYVNNEPDYIDDNKKLANYKGCVSSIVWYEDEYKDGYPTGKAVKLQIHPDEIKKLHAYILEVESRKSVEEYYDYIF